MKIPYVLLAGLLASCAAPRPSEAESPHDVQLFVERREICDHFRGEVPDPGEEARMGEVERGIEEYCASTDQELAILKTKYSSNDLIMLQLGRYEHRIEASESTTFQVLDVSPAGYYGSKDLQIEEACRNWALSPQQVEKFFLLSDTYDDRPYNRFYQMDCGISGHLHAEGRRWSFSINGGGTAIWQTENTTRHFGCSVAECGPLLLLPGDGMEPD